MPKLKQDHEISLQAESDDLDEVMAQNGVTEDQPANSHEPKVTGALESKNQAPNEAAAALKRYRKQENTLLKRARNYPAKPSKDELIAMYGGRAKVLLEDIWRPDRDRKAGRDPIRKGPQAFCGQLQLDQESGHRKAGCALGKHGRVLRVSGGAGKKEV
ncbi:MAG: hypothetical protein AAGN35_05535 [Bacteroidota bacterium]